MNIRGLKFHSDLAALRGDGYMWIYGWSGGGTACGQE